jgi:hypothetical protein
MTGLLAMMLLVTVTAVPLLPMAPPMIALLVEKVSFSAAGPSPCSVALCEYADRQRRDHYYQDNVHESG